MIIHLHVFTIHFHVDRIKQLLGQPESQEGAEYSTLVALLAS